MMSLRWLLLGSHVPPGGHRGGMVRYTVELGKALARHPDVHLGVLADAAAADTWRQLLGDSVEVFTLPHVPAPVQAWLERNRRPWPASAKGFDVVHGTKHIVPRRCDAVRVMTIHDFLPLDRPSDYGRAKRLLLPGPYLASVNDCDRLFCVSGATRDRLLGYAPHAYERSTVIAPGGDSSLLVESEPEVVERLRGRRFALVVGDPSPRKNLPLVVDSWPAVRGDVGDAVLAVVGPPSWGPQLTGSATLDSQVEMLGYLTDPQLKWCYQNATVVLFPSLLEGYGLPAVEALGLGAPLITSEDAALCEVSGGRAAHISTLQPSEWVDAITRAFREGRPPGGPSRDEEEAPVVRSWLQAADEMVRDVADAL